MAQNDPYDDGLNITDLIKSSEKSTDSFENFLDKYTRPVTKGNDQCKVSVADASASSSASGSSDVTEQKSETSVPDAIAPTESKPLNPMEYIGMFSQKYPGLSSTTIQLMARSHVAKLESEARAKVSTPTKSPTYISTSEKPISKQAPLPVPPAIPESRVPPVPDEALIAELASETSKVSRETITAYTEVTTVHNHPIVGTYISTEQVKSGDEELDKIHLNVYEEAVASQMSWEQVLHTIHQCRRRAEVARTAEMSLYRRLEELIGSMNDQQRSALRERDKTYRAQAKGKSPKSAKGESKASATKTSTSLKPSNDAEKQARALFDAIRGKETLPEPEEVLTILRKRGKATDDSLIAYVTRLCSQ